jgi:hypothetical protein
VEGGREADVKALVVGAWVVQGGVGATRTAATRGPQVRTTAPFQTSPAHVSVLTPPVLLPLCVFPATEGGSGEGRFERKPSSRQRPQPGSAEGAKTVVITTPSTAPASSSSSSSSGPAASANRGPRPSNGAQKWPTLKEATAKK